jgi:hypothetical protein
MTRLTLLLLFFTIARSPGGAAGRVQRVVHRPHDARGLLSHGDAKAETIALDRVVSMERGPGSRRG